MNNIVKPLKTQGDFCKTQVDFCKTQGDFCTHFKVKVSAKILRSKFSTLC